jgi:hypothetical protein
VGLVQGIAEALVAKDPTTAANSIALIMISPPFGVSYYKTQYR